MTVEKQLPRTLATLEDIWEALRESNDDERKDPHATCIETRCGEKVKLYAIYTHKCGTPLVHGAIRLPGDTYWIMQAWEGSKAIYRGLLGTTSSARDLVKPLLSGTYWMNIYLRENGKLPEAAYRFHSSKEEADKCAHTSRIACIKVPWVQGEGLEND